MRNREYLEKRLSVLKESLKRLPDYEYARKINELWHFNSISTDCKICSMEVCKWKYKCKKIPLSQCVLLFCDVGKGWNILRIRRHLEKEIEKLEKKLGENKNDNGNNG